MDRQADRRPQAGPGVRRRAEPGDAAGEADSVDFRPRDRVEARHHSTGDRRRAVRRVRPAPGVDDLHAAQSVSRRPGCGQERRRSVEPPLRALRRHAFGRRRSASDDGDHESSGRSGGYRAARPVPVRGRVVQSRTRLHARHGGFASARHRSANRITADRAGLARRVGGDVRVLAL